MLGTEEAGGQGESGRKVVGPRTQMVLSIRGRCLNLISQTLKRQGSSSEKTHAKGLAVKVSDQ